MPTQGVMVWIAARRIAACVLLGVAWATADSARAEDTYRWLDPQGRVHFGAVPPADATGVERIEPGGGKGSFVIVPGASPALPARPHTGARSAARKPAVDDSEPSVIGGRSEAKWRSDALARERKVHSLGEQLEKAEDQLSSAYALGDSAYYQRKVDRLKSQLEQAKEDLERFEDQARELGVPPGWLR